MYFNPVIHMLIRNVACFISEIIMLFIVKYYFFYLKKIINSLRLFDEYFALKLAVPPEGERIQIISRIKGAISHDSKKGGENISLRGHAG